MHHCMQYSVNTPNILQAALSCYLQVTTCKLQLTNSKLYKLHLTSYNLKVKFQMTLDKRIAAHQSPR
eukprot:5230536-Amphidinium_carterae.1